MSGETRIERDLLGEVAVPAAGLHGAHTERALENFPLAGEPVHGELARAFGTVKLACARTNRTLGAWAGDEATAMMAKLNEIDGVHLQKMVFGH